VILRNALAEVILEVAQLGRKRSSWPFHVHAAAGGRSGQPSLVQWMPRLRPAQPGESSVKLVRRSAKLLFPAGPAGRELSRRITPRRAGRFARRPARCTCRAERSCGCRRSDKRDSPVSVGFFPIVAINTYFPRRGRNSTPSTSAIFDAVSSRMSRSPATSVDDGRDRCAWTIQTATSRSPRTRPELVPEVR
jgi:hypothetical protein